jgi:nucleotide-binding universal stress UspA family protein
MAEMFKRILLLVDSTKATSAAAECAIALARLCNADLIALSVVDTETLKELLTYKIMVAEEMEEYEKELEHSGRRQLALVEEQARKAKVDVETVHKKGSVHSVVLAQQADTGADVIVVSGFRPSVIKRDLLAREKQLILDEATCAVIVVKKK